MRLRHLVLLLLLNCGWASLPALAHRLEGFLEPREFIFLRFAFGFVGLLLVWPWLPGTLPRGRDFWRCVGMGVTVFTVGHLLQIAGMQRSRATDASVILALDPLISSLGAALFLHERIPGRRWAGFALAMGGVVWISSWQRESPLPGLVANLLITLSFVSEAVWSVAGKPLITRHGIPKVTGLALGAGTFTNALLLIPQASTHWEAFARLPLEGWLSMAFLGLVLTAFGYSIWYVVIREVPVSVASMTIYLQPIFGTFVAALATGERLLASHAWGAAAILSGIILGLWQRSHAMPSAESSQK